MGKEIKLMGKTTNENFECHLHSPQFRKGICVLNIIIQVIMEKKNLKEKDPKGTPKTFMPLAKVQKPNGSKNLGSNPKKNQVAHLWE